MPFSLSGAGGSKEKMWVCDIAEEKSDTTNNDFLFMCDIQSGGKVVAAKKDENANHCIFGEVMYDINKFTPDTMKDKKLSFGIEFGKNTAERTDCPGGWSVEFKDLEQSGTGWKGTVNTSWWGDRAVELLPFDKLTPEQVARYPDTAANYYKTPA